VTSDPQAECPEAFASSDFFDQTGRMQDLKQGRCALARNPRRHAANPGAVRQAWRATDPAQHPAPIAGHLLPRGPCPVGRASLFPQTHAARSGAIRDHVQIETASRLRTGLRYPLGVLPAEPSRKDLRRLGRRGHVGL